MREQKMTKSGKNGSTEPDSAPIRRIYRLAHRRVDEIAKIFGQVASPVGYRKTLAL